MRALTLSAAVVLFFAGCGSPALPIYTQASWLVRCDAAGMCIPMTRTVIGSNGDSDAGSPRSTCTVRKTAGKVSFLSFFATDPAGNYVRVQNCGIDTSGNATGVSCTVAVREAGLTYSGSASGGVPSMTTPCQLTEVMTELDPDGNPQLVAKLYCRYLFQDADNTVLRELTSPSSAMSAADFRFVYCTGANS